MDDVALRPERVAKPPGLDLEEVHLDDEEGPAEFQRTPVRREPDDPLPVDRPFWKPGPDLGGLAAQLLRPGEAVGEEAVEDVVVPGRPMPGEAGEDGHLIVTPANPRRVSEEEMDKTIDDVMKRRKKVLRRLAE